MATLGYGSTYMPPLSTAQPLSFGSLSAYGSAPYGSAALGSGVPAPMTGQMPAVPDVSVPMINSPATVSTMGPVAGDIGAYGAGVSSFASPGMVVGSDPLSDGLRSALTPDAGAGGFMSNFFQDGKLNFNNLGMLAKGIAGFGQLWGAFQQNNLAKEAFAFQKDAYNRNVENQTSDYNRSMEDQIRARYHQEGRSTAEADAYVAKHRLEK